MHSSLSGQADHLYIHLKKKRAWLSPRLPPEDSPPPLDLAVRALNCIRIYKRFLHNVLKPAKQDHIFMVKYLDLTLHSMGWSPALLLSSYGNSGQVTVIYVLLLHL